MVSVLKLPDEHADACFARILDDEQGAIARCVGDANLDGRRIRRI